MSQNEFELPGDHEAARLLWNANANDAEARLLELEKPNYSLRTVGPLGPFTTRNTWVVADTWSSAPNPQHGTYAFDYYIVWNSSAVGGNRDMKMRYQISDGVTTYYTDEYESEVTGDTNTTHIISGFDDFGISGDMTLTITLEVYFTRGNMTIPRHKFRFTRVTEDTTAAVLGSLP